MPIRIRVRVDADRTTEQFKTARRELGRRTGQAIKRAGERVVLPAARSRIYSFARSTLVVRARSRSAVLTSTLRGKMGRALGLLEFGGTVRTVIQPKSKQALTVGPNVVRANVKGPRRYQGQHRLEKVVAERLPATEEAILQEIMPLFGELRG